MVEREELLEYLSSNKSHFMMKYHLTKIGLFSSIARAEHTTISDIDLLVEFEENTPNLYEIKYNLKKEIQGVFNKSVDICRENYIKPIFRNQILAEVSYL